MSIKRVKPHCRFKQPVSSHRVNTHSTGVNGPTNGDGVTQARPQPTQHRDPDPEIPCPRPRPRPRDGRLTEHSDVGVLLARAQRVPHPALVATLVGLADLGDPQPALVVDRVVLPWRSGQTGSPSDYGRSSGGDGSSSEWFSPGGAVRQAHRQTMGGAVVGTGLPQSGSPLAERSDRHTVRLWEEQWWGRVFHRVVLPWRSGQTGTPSDYGRSSGGDGSSTEWFSPGGAVRQQAHRQTMGGAVVGTGLPQSGSPLAERSDSRLTVRLWEEQWWGRVFHRVVLPWRSGQTGTPSDYGRSSGGDGSSTEWFSPGGAVRQAHRQTMGGAVMGTGLPQSGSPLAERSDSRLTVRLWEEQWWGRVFHRVVLPWRSGQTGSPSDYGRSSDGDGSSTEWFSPGGAVRQQAHRQTMGGAVVGTGLPQSGSPMAERSDRLTVRLWEEQWWGRVFHRVVLPWRSGQTGTPSDYGRSCSDGQTVSLPPEHPPIR